MCTYLLEQAHREEWQRHMKDSSNLIGRFLLALSSAWKRDVHSMERRETPGWKKNNIKNTTYICTRLISMYISVGVMVICNCN